MSAFLASGIVLAVIVGVLRLILVEIEAAADDAVEEDAIQAVQDEETAMAPGWVQRGPVVAPHHRVDARVRWVVLVAFAGTLVAALVSAMVALVARVAR